MKSPDHWGILGKINPRSRPVRKEKGAPTPGSSDFRRHSTHLRAIRPPQNRTGGLCEGGDERSLGLLEASQVENSSVVGDNARPG